MALVDRVVIEDFDIHLPLLQVVGLGDRDARGYVLFQLEWSETIRSRKQVKGSSPVCKDAPRQKQSLSVKPRRKSRLGSGGIRGRLVPSGAPM